MLTNTDRNAVTEFSLGRKPQEYHCKNTHPVRVVERSATLTGWVIVSMLLPGVPLRSTLG